MKELIGFFGHGVFLLSILLFVFQSRRWKQYWPIPYLISAVIIILPIQDWLLIEFSRGYFSDLSAATILLCLLGVLNHTRPQPIKVGVSFYLFILLLACVLYPATLGLSMNDPFVLGYATANYYPVFVVSLVLIAIAAWFKGFNWISLYIVMCLLAQGFDIYGSGNLWLYLMDPIAVIMSLVALVWIASKASLQKVKNAYTNKKVSDVSEHA